jgi:hypothetical protein
MRSYIEALRAQGCLEQVQERVTPEVLERMTILPTSSEWVSTHLSNGVLDAYVGLRDLDAVRAMARDANRGGIVRIIEPIIRTAMRIGGGGPDAMLSRLELVLGRQQRGYAFHWTKGDDGRSGTLVIETRGVSETPASVASWEGGLANAFDLSGMPGTLRSTKCVPHHGGSVTTFLAKWSPA